MEIIVHYPAGTKEYNELIQLATQAFSDAAIQYIKNLNCSAEQKVLLTERVICDIRQKK